MSICKSCRNHDKCKFDFKDTVTSCSFIYPKEDMREQEIRNKAIDEFAEKLTAHFNDWLYQEAPSNDDETDRTRHIICDTICDAIGGISEIAEQMKGE